MRQIRRGVFETNSSSTHSLTIVDYDEFEKFKSGKYLINWKKEFISREEVIKELKELIENGNIIPENEDDLLNLFINYEYNTYENYAGEWCEKFEKVYTTKSGDKVVAFGYYGNDY